MARMVRSIDKQGPDTEASGESDGLLQRNGELPLEQPLPVFDGITVDSREPSMLYQLIVGAARKEEIEIRKEALLTGDYAWESRLGLFGVERKAASDLLNSFSSGRAAEQFRRMVGTYRVPVLLIEGRIGELETGGVDVRKGRNKHSLWNFDSLDHMLLTWQMNGMFLAHSPIASRTPMKIISLYKWSNKKSHSGGLRSKMLMVPEMELEL